MNVFNFLGLLKSIYGKTPPDLEKIQQKGLLAVKIAQHYALRIDFLDEEVCRHLAKLYRHNIEISSEKVGPLLKSYVDPSWFNEIKSFDPEPFASASIGQVHNAVLNDGTRAVVKVIKRDFKNEFLRDVRSLRRLFKFIIFFYPKLSRVFDPLGILEHIEDYTLSELNLLNEIEGQTLLKGIHEEYRDRYDLERLKFHRIIPELSNQNVLVSEYIDGQSFDELLEMKKLPYELLLDLFNIHGFYMFTTGKFHGDIHPGNIILDEKGKFNFIDTGAISYVGNKIGHGLFNFFEALTFYDYAECAKRVNNMAEGPVFGKRYKKFEELFFDLYKDFANKTVSEISLTKKMMETIKLGVNCGMEFEKGMFSIIKSLMYLDGMVLRCNPNAVLMKDLRSFIERFKKVLHN
jgi:ubiquinone biosynthesis protein